MKRRFSQTPASLATQLSLWNEPAAARNSKGSGTLSPRNAGRGVSRPRNNDAMPADIRTLVTLL